MATFKEYEAAASAAHSHRLFEMSPILSCSPIPVGMCTTNIRGRTVSGDEMKFISTEERKRGFSTFAMTTKRSNPKLA
jgi:hypothetical protein